jgi:polyhydroxyalkanoate synthesis repressor PhaR
VQRTKRRRGRPPGRDQLDPSLTLIKKYGNRRLYDTRRSRYVTLEELAETIAAGEEIRVIDSRSGANLTKQVVTKIILVEEERRGLDLLPLPFLCKLIQHGGQSGPEAIGAELEELKARILNLEAWVKR